ncbi:hypothetical protein HQ584_13285, partial [Patescibacteria group bacterium]|nr:hypothetical protein [Patescibacteria group bacterium]
NNDGDNEDKDNEDKDKEKEDEDKEKKLSENFISKSTHSKQMNELKSKLGVVEKKLRFKEVTATVGGFVFSESNPKGVLLPKNSEKAVELLMSATPKVAKLFNELMSELPAVSAKLFQEKGSGDDGKKSNADKVQTEATKLMEDGKAQTYGEAIKILSSQNSELLK